MSPARRDDHLRGEVTIEFDGTSHKREFVISSNLAKLHGHFEPKDWPVAPNGTRMLKEGMRSEVSYMVQKTAEECLRHVLYEMTGEVLMTRRIVCLAGDLAQFAVADDGSCFHWNGVAWVPWERPGLPQPTIEEVKARLTEGKRLYDEMFPPETRVSGRELMTAREVLVREEQASANADLNARFYAHEKELDEHARAVNTPPAEPAAPNQQPPSGAPNPLGHPDFLAVERIMENVVPTVIQGSGAPKPGPFTRTPRTPAPKPGRPA